MSERIELSIWQVTSYRSYRSISLTIESGSGVIAVGIPKEDDYLTKSIQSGDRLCICRPYVLYPYTKLTITKDEVDCPFSTEGPKERICTYPSLFLDS